MSDKLLVQKLSIDNGRDREKQDRNCEHHPSDKGKRALENIPLGVPVEEGQQHQHGPKEAGQCHRTDAGKDHSHPDDVLPNLAWKKIVGLRLQLYRRTSKWTSRSRTSKKEEMQPGQPNQGCGEHHYVNDKEPAQCHLSGGRTSLEEARHEVAKQRHLIQNLDADGRGPIGSLVPREQITREAEYHDDAEERQTNQPDKFTWFLIGAPEKDLGHMCKDADHHGRGAPE